jgi:radical SAM protein with 4Fe4S-binding SPASM domain
MREKKRSEYLLNTPGLVYNILLRGRYDFEYDLMDIHIGKMPLKKRLNLLKSGANLIYRKLHPWGWPLHMHVELTNYCNLRCKVCPTGIETLKRKPAALDPAILERIIREAGPYLLTLSLWGWGEPLLHPRLSEILRLVHGRGIITFLSTNGQNLDDPEVLKALIEYPPTYLIVAIDGMTDETYSAYRVGAKLAPALAGVNRLAQMKRERGQQFPILHHRYIVMKHNEHELPLLKQFAMDNHFDICTIRTLSIIDFQNDAGYRELVPENSRFSAYEYENNVRVSRRDFICEKAFIFPAVFADGTLVDCDQDFNASQAYGNLVNSPSFSALWQSKKAAKIRKTIRDDMDSFSHCKNCPFKDRSVTDCSVIHFDLK